MNAAEQSRRRSGRRVVTALAAATALLAACQRGGGDDGPPVPGDVAVAEVGDRTIWASDVKREAAAQRLITEGEPLDTGSATFRRVLDEVVDRRLLALEAERRNLDDGPAARRRLQAAQDQVLGDMVIEEAVGRSVNEDAVRALYREQLRLSQSSEQFRARQIVTRTPEEARAVRRLLDAGGDFDQLAVERSTDAATRFNGGDLGYFTADVMPPAYAEALEGVRPGQLVGPFQTAGGWVLLRLEDRRREEPLTLQEARPQILRFLTYDEIRELIQTLRRGAEIRYLIARPAGTAAPREPASAPPGAPPASTGPAAPPPGTAGARAPGYVAPTASPGTAPPRTVAPPPRPEPPR